MLESRAACATYSLGALTRREMSKSIQQHYISLAMRNAYPGRQASPCPSCARAAVQAVQASSENFPIHSPQPAALHRERSAACDGDEKQTELPKTSNSRRQRIAQLLESECEKERVASRGIRRVGTGRHATVDDGERSKNSQPIPRGVVQAQHSSKYMQRDQIHTVPYCAVYKTSVAVAACLRTRQTTDCLQ